MHSTSWSTNRRRVGPNYSILKGSVSKWLATGFLRVNQTDTKA
jgi:hypothetical protein